MPKYIIIYIYYLNGSICLNNSKFGISYLKNKPHWSIPISYDETTCTINKRMC